MAKQNFRQTLFRFLRDSSIYGVDRILSKVITFFLIPVYTAYLTPADYGNLQYILTIGAFLRAFFQMGLASSFWRFRSQKTPFSNGEVTLNFTLTQLFVGTSVLLLGFMVKFWLSEKSVLGTLIIIYLLALIIKVIYDNVLVVVRANHKPKLYVLISVSQTALLLVFNIFFLVYLKYNYQGVIYSYLAVFSMTGLLFYHILHRECSGKFELKLSQQMLLYGFPIMLGNIAATIISLSDRFFLKEFSGDTELGLYSYGYKYGDLISTFLIQTIHLAWNPMRWEIYDMENGEEIFSKFSRLLFIFLPALGLLGISGLLILGGLMTSNKEYLQGFRILGIIVFSHILYGLYWFNSMGLHFKNKTHVLMNIVLGCGMVNLVLNFALVPRLGMLGAAIGTILSYFLMFMLGRNYSQKYYPIARNTGFETSQLLMIGISVTLLTYLFYTIESLSMAVIVSASLSVAYIVINLLLRNLRLKDFANLRRIIFPS